MAYDASYMLVAFLLVAVLILLLAPLAHKVGLVDRPNARKTHGRNVPLVGGISIFLSFMLLSFLGDFAHRPPSEFTFGLALLVIVGILDDWLDLRPAIRLVAQLSASLLMLMPGGHVVSSLGSAFGGSVSIGMFGLPFTVVVLIGLINAYNMLDGIDGLAGGGAASAFFWLSIVAGGSGQVAVLITLQILFWGTLGFLVFNLRSPVCRERRVFLGDAGSTMIGAAIAWAVINLSAPAEGGISFVSLLWVCALPAIDTVSLTVRRLEAGRSPFAADRNHLHHLLLKQGMPEGKVAGTIVGLCFMCGGVGVGGAWIGIPDFILGAGLFGALLIHTAFVSWMALRQRSRTSHVQPDATQIGIY